jgi:hypothetical protein
MPHQHLIQPTPPTLPQRSILLPRIAALALPFPDAMAPTHEQGAVAVEPRGHMIFCRPADRLQRVLGHEGKDVGDAGEGGFGGGDQVDEAEVGVSDPE